MTTGPNVTVAPKPRSTGQLGVFSGQITAGPGAERAGRSGQHAAVGAGDRRYQAARREHRIRAARRAWPRRPSAPRGTAGAQE